MWYESYDSIGNESFHHLVVCFDMSHFPPETLQDLQQSAWEVQVPQWLDILGERGFIIICSGCSPLAQEVRNGL